MILARKSDGVRFSGQIRGGGRIYAQTVALLGVGGPFVALAPAVAAEHFRLVRANYVERLRLERAGYRIEAAAPLADLRVREYPAATRKGASAT